MKKNNTHKLYEEYISFQKEKTNDPKRIKKWKTEEWEQKIEVFDKLFCSKEYLKNCKNALCLGSRTGQEVVSLNKLGIDSIGIDLQEFPPYTIKGDVHNIPYDDSSFDFVYSNIFDHVLYPDKFISEIERVLKKGGICLLHLQVNVQSDKYTETFVENVNLDIIPLIKNSNILSNHFLEKIIFSANWELCFEKQ